MQLEAANAQLAQQRPALVQDILCQSLASARATLADARGVIDELRAITTFDEFSKGVHDEISRFRVASGIACHAQLYALAVVPADLYEPALRAIREGLNNVAQHAQAQQVWVRIEPEQDERMFAIEVQDDGVGFEPATLTRRPGHYGLIGLRERARLTRGALEVSSAPGAGTLLRLRLPSSAGAYAA